MTEPREKGWVSMGLPEPGPVRGMRGVVGLLLLLLLFDDLVACCCGLMMGSIVFCVMSMSWLSSKRSQAKSQVTSESHKTQQKITRRDGTE